MREPRLFVDSDITADAMIRIADDRAHYLHRVLRLRAGDSLVLFNGQGGEWAANIASCGKRETLIEVREPRAVERDSPLRIHLGIGLSRGERMDWVVQKSTELGVTSITPLQLQRCTARSSGERADKRLRHWQQVIVAACEQCGRNRLPEISSPMALGDWLADCDAGLRLVLAPGAAGICDLESAPAGVALLIGPEGGLDAVELAAAQSAGFEPWQLGPRILRTETAPLVALSILQYCLGDYVTEPAGASSRS